MLTKLLILTSLIFISLSAIADYSYDYRRVPNDFVSPIHDEQAREILYWGGSATLLLTLFRDNGTDQLQRDVATSKPLGETLSTIGDYSGQVIPNALYVGYMAYSGSHKRAALMLKTTIFAGGTTTILKRIFNQPRPHKGDNNSFPSGHTTTAFSFATVVALEHPQFRYYSYGLAGLVALSRMNDNQHYLHDVVAGATIGMAFGHAFFNSQGDVHAYSNFDILPIKDGLFASYGYRY